MSGILKEIFKIRHQKSRENMLSLMFDKRP